MNDRELAQAFLAGITAAEEQIHRWLMEFVPRRFYYDNVISPDDIISDTLIILLEKLRNNEFSFESPLKPFVCGIARNLIGDIIRRRHIERDYKDYLATEPEASDDPYKAVFSSDFMQIFLRAMGFLKEECRQLLEMVLVKDIEGKKAADILEISYQNLRTRLSRCKGRLKDLIERHTGGEL